MQILNVYNMNLNIFFMLVLALSDILSVQLVDFEMAVKGYEVQLSKGYHSRAYTKIYKSPS